MSKRLHVVPRDDGWAVHREGADRDSAHAPTQSEAVERAAEIALFLLHQQVEYQI